MKIIKKLISTFHKQDFAEAIDYCYGVMRMWVRYYVIFVLTAGLFYLSEFVPGNILKKIWGEIPLEFIGTQFQNGTFSELAMCFLLFYVFLETADKFLMIYPRRAKVLTIIEIWICYFLVKIFVSFSPVVTPDTVIMSVCCFFVIRLALKFITAKFRISTRHFGSIIVIENFPEVANLKDSNGNIPE